MFVDNFFARPLSAVLCAVDFLQNSPQAPARLFSQHDHSSDSALEKCRVTQMLSF